MLDNVFEKKTADIAIVWARFFGRGCLPTSANHKQPKRTAIRTKANGRKRKEQCVRKVYQNSCKNHNWISKINCNSRCAICVFEHKSTQQKHLKIHLTQTNTRLFIYLFAIFICLYSLFCKKKIFRSKSNCPSWLPGIQRPARFPCRRR